MPEYGLAENAKVLTFDFYLGGVTPDNNNKNVSANFSAKLCMDIYQKIAIPLHNVAWNANLYRSGGESHIIAGDKACDGMQKCLNNITLAEIHNICSTCTQGGELCAIAMHF